MLSPSAIPPSRRSSSYRRGSPHITPIRTGSPVVGYGRSGTHRPESPARLSPLEGRDQRQTRHETVSRSGSPYRAPGRVSSPRLSHSPHLSVPSISVSQPSRQGGSQVHSRSLSMNAGSTPLRTGKPLSPLSTILSLGDGLAVAPTLRRQPSVASSLSSNRSSYKAYDPNEALDPAYLASQSAEYVVSPTYAQHRSRSGRM
jgi:hypothetical protein